MQSPLMSLLMTVTVIALIPLALWSWKRLQAGRGGGATRQMEIVAQLALGPRERVVLLRVQGQVLVLGATAHQVTLLGQAEQPAWTSPQPLPATPSGVVNDFAARLGRALGAAPRQPGDRA